ncbi:hypothetical protein PFISCL1PPCAC_4833, partial [Pristionchus fissidentatus]
KLKRGIIQMPSIERLPAAIELVKHYINQSELDRKTFNAIISSLSHGEFKQLLRKCPRLPDQLKAEAEAELQEGSQFITLTIQPIGSGRPLTLSVEMARRPTGFLIKKMIEDCERIPCDQLRLIQCCLNQLKKSSARR